MTPERGLLTPDELYASAARLVEYDRAKHPEWLLPSAEVLPFPQRR